MIKFFFVTTLIAYLVVGGIFLGIKYYHVYRDVDCWIDRAQVAADRDDMLEYLNKLKTNMEKWGMTQGHTAILFKTPMTDLSLHYKSIERHIERLEGIIDVPKNDVVYQTALDDIRGTIRELPDPGAGWLWVHYTWWMLLIGVGILICVFSFPSSKRDVLGSGGPTLIEIFIWIAIIMLGIAVVMGVAE